MSTNDLVRRARRWLTDALPHNQRGLMIELVDEVDQLRGERDRWKARSVTAGADLDAARAALERVRDIATDTSDRHPSTRILNPQDILNALEGES